MLSKELAVFLHNRGFGIFDETGVTGDIFINTLPDRPDASIGIYTAGGPSADPFNEYSQESVQVLIRTIPNDPRVGEVTAKGVIDALNGFNSGYLADGGRYIVNVTAQQSGPNNIGKDKKDRFEYSQNFIIEYVKGGNE